MNLTIEQITAAYPNVAKLESQAGRELLAEVVGQMNALAAENAALTSGCGFFAYDPDNGFEDFKTKAEAIEAAESYIDYYRDDAGDGWADEVSQVSWGVFMQQATMVDERLKNSEDSVSKHIDTVCDFALLPAIDVPATDAAIANIRAQGVEMLRDSIAEIENSVEGTRDLHHYCTDFAAHLRQGAAL